jgi:hypothetical protein
MRKVFSAITLASVWSVVILGQAPATRGAAPSPPTLPAVTGLHGELPGKPVFHRELAKVVFRSPVRVMEVWLLGSYVIEHDEERMQNGGPCTHIYRLKDRSKPVVAFHCKHLNRTRQDASTYTLKRSGTSPGTFDLVEFQFAGSADGHGVPTDR